MKLGCQGLPPMERTLGAAAAVYGAILHRHAAVGAAPRCGTAALVAAAAGDGRAIVSTRVGVVHR